jgi:hypothetical protein
MMSTDCKACLGAVYDQKQSTTFQNLSQPYSLYTEIGAFEGYMVRDMFGMNEIEFLTVEFMLVTKAESLYYANMEGLLVRLK